MTLNAHDIDELEFGATFRGYNPDEVDAALDRIALAFHRLEHERDELLEQQRELIAEREEREQSLLELQQRAQQLARDNDTLRAHEHDADESATVEELRAALERLTEERDRLREDVARLRRASDARWADNRAPQPAVVTLPPEVGHIAQDVPPPPPDIPDPPPHPPQPGDVDDPSVTLPRPPNAW